MAELRSAEAALEALEASVAALRASQETPPVADDAASVDALRETVRSVALAVDGDVHATMAKFRERVKMVDPVTNEPRFGPKTMARVTAMLATYDALYEELAERELLARSQRLVDAVDAEKASEAARQEELQRQLALAREAEQREREAQRQREAAEQEAQRQRELAAEQKRVEELARLAQLKREERERQRLAEEAAAREEQERLARVNAAAQVGLEGLQKAVARLRDATPGSDAALFRKSLQKLHALIGNVCAAPEKAAFRHIPKDNAHFHEDIGRHEGGYECLLAMGFKELEPEPGKRVFILEEPDLSEDFDKWSLWFDGLKEMKEWLEALAAE